jgi:hypothetical protein
MNNDSVLEGKLADCRKSGGKVLCFTFFRLNPMPCYSWAELIRECVREFPRLEHLSFDCADCDDEGFQAVIAATRSGEWGGLTVLDLASSHITDVSIQSLAHAVAAGYLPRLTDLDLTRITLADDTLAAIASAADAGGLSGLERLCLSQTRLSCNGLRMLADMAQDGRMEAIEEFEIDNNRIGDEGLRALVRVGRAGCWKSLEVLDLSDTKVTDKGVRALADLGKAGHWPQLSLLNLSGNGISDDSLRSLGSVVGAGNWARLDLGICGTAISIHEDIRLLPAQICDWLQYLPDGHLTSRLPEAKILVLGQGGVGKSTLCERVLLTNESKDDRLLHMPLLEETHDIDMHGIECVLLNSERRINFRLWDFGGQNHLHGMHRFFIGAERAMYLLVIDGSRTSKHNRLEYWLRFLAHYGKSASGGTTRCAPVILVITKCDAVAMAEAGLPTYSAADGVLSCAQELRDALDIARKYGWYGANIVEVVDEMGYPGPEHRLSVELADRLKKSHRESAMKLWAAIWNNIPSVIGMNFEAPQFVMKAYEWINGHFETDVRTNRLKKIRYDQTPLLGFIRSEKRKEEPNDRGNVEITDRSIERRLRPALLLLKSLGLIHWISGVGEVARSHDDAVLKWLFNPRWVKHPVYKLIRLSVVDYPGGWIDYQQLTEQLLPERERVVTDVPPKNDREWFDMLEMTGEDRKHLVDLMVDCGVAYLVSTPDKQGVLIPDCLAVSEPDRSYPADGLVADYRTDFLSERILLRFLAGYIEAQLIEKKEFPVTVFRNWAKLAWRHRGSDYDVWVQAEVCPEAGERPWLRIAVGGGAREQRQHVLDSIKDKIDQIVKREALPPLELVRISDEIQATTPPPVSAPVQRRQRKRVDQEIANLKVRKFLELHPNASKEAVANAGGVSVGTLSKLSAWQESRGKKAKKLGPEAGNRARRERQLSDQQIAVLGSADRGFEQVDELEAFYSWLRKQSKTTAELERLTGMSKEKLLQLLEATKSQMTERQEVFPWMLV